jgi:hypothetical protein
MQSNFLHNNFTKGNVVRNGLGALAGVCLSIVVSQVATAQPTNDAADSPIAADPSSASSSEPFIEPSNEPSSERPSKPVDEPPLELPTNAKPSLDYEPSETISEDSSVSFPVDI